MALLLGCIADDYTGGTDLAGTLVQNGMRTVQTVCGVPDADWLRSLDADAVVVALKSRTIPVQEAVEQSLASLRALQQTGVKQFFFKYCSTFDSTARGNIGPVADALADALDAQSVPFCPAFPKNGRTIFKGYLFAGDVLLNESGMQDHPLTPMKDPNLQRVLASQSRHSVGLIPYDVIHRGVDSIIQAMHAEVEAGRSFLIVDAINDDDLRAIGSACKNLQLITGGSGIAIGLPENFRQNGELSADVVADQLGVATGKSAIISGSCSRMTRQQVEAIAPERRFKIDVMKLLQSSEALPKEALNWAEDKLSDDPILIYSTTDPEEVAQAQNIAGVQKAGEVVEQCLAQVAAGLVARGVGKLVVAGGETSGAVVQALGVQALRIGPDIDPGVPWTQALDSNGEGFIHLALKSGNFGALDFFTKAFQKL